MTRIVLLACLTACGPSISGQIDGEPVSGAREAIFDEITIDLGPLGDYTAVTVMVTDLKDSCAVYDDILDNLEPTCEERCEDLSRIANEDLGADSYFNLFITLIADPDRVEGEFGFVASAPGEDEFTADFNRWDVSALYDEQGCVETCQAGNDVIEQNAEGASGGALTIDGYTAGEQVRGDFDLEFGAESLTGSFSAERCDAISSWFGLGQ